MGKTNPWTPEAIEPETVGEVLADYNGQITRELYLNDLHTPYCDPYVWELVLNFAAWFKPGRIFLNGDLVDFYSVSFFTRDPRRVWENNLQREIDIARAELGHLREAVPNAIIYYIEGNHEKRLLKWLWKQDQAASLRALEFENLMGLKDFDPIEWWPENRYLFDRGFLVTHGRRLSMHSSMTAKLNYETLRCSALVGHSHRIGCYYQTVRTEEGFKTFAIYENGCLADLEKCSRDYVPGGSPNWQQGFSVSYHVGKKPRFFLIQIPIVGGKFIFDGKLWEA